MGVVQPAGGQKVKGHWPGAAGGGAQAGAAPDLCGSFPGADVDKAPPVPDEGEKRPRAGKELLDHDVASPLGGMGHVRGRWVRRAWIALTLALSALAGSARAEAYVSLGTGGATGVYYPAGGAICRMVNAGSEAHGVYCGVESTDGSLDNIAGLRAGRLDFALVQSDWQDHAREGSGLFASLGPFEDLRSVFALHDESFTVLARADAGIAEFRDLRGKRVNLGSHGSGQHGTMLVLMEALGWTTGDFSEVVYLGAVEQSVALCDGQVDAIVYMVGHPSGAIQEATLACDAVLVPVDGPEVAALIAAQPQFRPTAIPGGVYRGNTEPVATFGVTATLVATAQVEEEVVHTLTRAVFEDLATFRRLHPALGGLTAEGMARAARSSPLHPGAARYFAEAGLLD